MEGPQPPYVRSPRRHGEPAPAVGAGLAAQGSESRGWHASLAARSRQEGIRAGSWFETAPLRTEPARGPLDRSATHRVSCPTPWSGLVTPSAHRGQLVDELFS